MGTTFSTDQECFTAITMTDATVGATTRPSSGALTLLRDRAYAKIYALIGTSTDINNVAKDFEIELVTRMATNRLEKLHLSEELTEDQELRLICTFNVLPTQSPELNEDGALTD